MPKFDLETYVPVNERITKFWEQHPNGRLETAIVSSDSERVVVKALAFRDGEEHPCGTGHAEEIRDVGPVNKTSALENAETSAVGRALAMMGFEVTRGMASREEMQKVQRMSAAPASVSPQAPIGNKPKITAEQFTEFESDLRRRGLGVQKIISMFAIAGIPLGDVSNGPELHRALQNLSPDELREIKKYVEKTPVPS